MNDRPFTPTERLELKELGITMTQLSKRYALAVRRAEHRKQPILPRYTFYREFVRQLKQAAKKLNTPADKLFPLLDVHADPDYTNFKLLLRPSHKILHSELYRKQAAQTLSNGTAVCRHCGIEKPLTDFPRDPRTLTGIVKTCKECKKALREEKQALEVA